MAQARGVVRNHLTHWSVIILLIIQMVVYVGVIALQMLGFNQIAYVFSIVPAIAYTIFAIVAEVTGLPLMSISSFLPFGLILLPIPYYFSSIILAAPGRAVYRITHRDNKNNQTANEDQSEEIDTLRDRYVHGELTEEQFERKLSELLETQIPADTDEWQTNEREKLEE